MPTYEFRCPKGHEFERLYKTMSTAPHEVPCPECGAVSSRQLSGGGGLVFKGSGFYLTDYGKNAHRKPTEGEKAEGSKAEGPKAEGSKAEGSKAESSKSESSASKAQPKAESTRPSAEPTGTRPRAESNKPKNE